MTYKISVNRMSKHTLRKRVVKKCLLLITILATVLAQFSVAVFAAEESDVENYRALAEIAQLTYQKQQSAIDEMCNEWEQKYSKDDGWELTAPSGQSIYALPEKDDIQQLEALRLAVASTLASEEEGIDFFTDMRPFFLFSSERIWSIDFHPIDIIDNPKPSVFVKIDAATGGIVHYVETSPPVLYTDTSDKG